MEIALDAHAAEIFERLMLTAHVGVALVSPDGAFLRVNSALCRFFGRTEEQLVSSTWPELTHPEDVPDDAALFAELLAGEREEYRLRKRYLRVDGEVLWGDLSVSCLRDSHGGLLCFISQILDVTQLVHTRQELLTREEQYRLVVESSSDVVVMNSLEGAVEWISDNCAQITGYSPSELIGRNAFDVLVHPADRPHLHERLSTVLESPDSIRTIFSLQRKDGSALWVEASGRNGHDPFSGQPRRVVRWRNIDAEYRALQQLGDSERLFRTAMEASAVGMATLSLDRRFTRVNPALCLMLQRDEQWLLGRSIADVLDEQDDAADRALRARLNTGELTTATVDKKLVRASGERIDVRHAVGVLRDQLGQHTGYVSQFIDMTEVHRARGEIEFLAAHDPLTKVSNRRGIMRALEAVLRHPARTGNRTGVAFIDLDDFKPFNDQYGHAFGDRVLESIARRLRTSVRADDVVGRLGGDEFIIVLNGLHGGEEMARIADYLLAKIAEPLTIDGRTVTVTASLGFVLGQTGEDGEALLSRADAALYRSKKAGGNRATIA